MDIKIMEPSLQNRRKKLRVCAYCGVPAKEAEQINSLDEQIEYYEKLIREKPMYDFAGIYYDSGTYRFQEMMQAARDHQFDLIITKSVSCFCRNTDTLLKAVKELKELGIGIFFEQQKLNTLHLTGDVMLTVLAAFAQEESDRYNESAKDAGSGKCETKKPAKFLNRSFGFRKNAMGEYEPDPEEAPVVRIMFELCVEGYTPTQIATLLGRTE